MNCPVCSTPDGDRSSGGEVQDLARLGHTPLAGDHPKIVKVVVIEPIHRPAIPSVFSG